MKRSDAHRSLHQLFGLLIVCMAGCMHTIHVAPVPSSVSSIPIEQSVRVEVPLLALEGADHMPGIAMLEWPVRDFRIALINYIQQRRTFSAVSRDEGSLTLTVKAWLWLRSREVYQYIVHLEAELGPTGQLPINTYVVQKEAAGSNIRWVTASDQDPIAEAVQAAFDDLLMQIEQDAAVYGKMRRGGESLAHPSGSSHP